jgi:hypothetical protein
VNELMLDWNPEVPSGSEPLLRPEEPTCLSELADTAGLTVERVHSAEDFAEAIENYGRTYVPVNIGSLLDAPEFYDTGEANGMARLSSVQRSASTDEVESFQVSWRGDVLDVPANRFWAACVGRVCQLVPGESELDPG